MDFFLTEKPDNETVEISQAVLQQYWTSLIPKDSYAAFEAAQVFEKAFLQYSGQAREAAELAFLKGGWTLKLQAGLAKTALAGAFMAGLFCWMGFDAVSAVVLPSVLPFLFELEQVKLSKKEETLLVNIVIRQDVKHNLHTRRGLYNLLPPDLRKQINELDFLDFLEQLELAGHIQEYEQGWVKVLERPRFKVTFV